MIKTTNILKWLPISLPLLLSGGAVVLFVLGYTAHGMYGKENPIEEIAEELLKKEYNITVEFSNESEKK